MGLMDKVKAQATQIAQKTQEAAQEGKAKLDQAQATRRGDVLLRQLGAAVFADRTGRGTADTQSTIDQLVSAISAHERENGLNMTGATVPAPGSPADQPGSPADQPGSPADQPGSPADQPGSTSGPGTWSAPPGGGFAGGSQQDTPGGFPQSGQTFFPPPED